MTKSLLELLGIEEGDVVAFVGGGGKSTLTLGTGRELADAGKPVVLATTTKMGVDQIPDWADVCEDVSSVEAALRTGRPSYVLKRAEGSKVIGADPRLIDEIAETDQATIVIEADGSRGKPFKAPEDHEPVIPASTTLVVVVVGSDAIGQAIATTCHRPERVAALSGAAPQDLVQPEHVVAVVTHPAGGRKNVPTGARLKLALTKVGKHEAAAANRIRNLLPPDIELAVVPSH